MNNDGQKIVVGGICRPDGAWWFGGVLATKIAEHRQIQASERMMQKAHSIFADELESAAKILREAIRVTGKLFSKRVKQKAEK
jgi:hypothetical protein